MKSLNGSKIGHLTWSLNKLKALKATSPAPNTNSLTTSTTSSSSSSSTSNNTLTSSMSTPLLSGLLQTQQAQHVYLDENDQLEFRYYSGAQASSTNPIKSDILARSITLKLAQTATNSSNMPAILLNNSNTNNQSIICNKTNIEDDILTFKITGNLIFDYLSSSLFWI